MNGIHLLTNCWVGCIMFLMAGCLPSNLGASVDNAQAPSGDTGPHIDDNIAFEIPDLTVMMESEDGHMFSVEAYRTGKNDRIFHELETSPHKASQLQWVSSGHPLFLRTADRRNSTDYKLFHVAEDELYTKIQMLTDVHRRQLVSRAYEKYRINVTTSQFTLLPLTSFECSLKVYDNDGNKHLIVGKVGNFKQVPLRMDFEVPQQSANRKLFADKLLDDSSTLSFKCNMSAGAKLALTNTLVIEGHQLEQIGLAEKLFGAAQDAYVTREQLAELSSEMYSSLNIIEEYQMPEHTFSEEFVDGLISQLASEQFQKVPVDTAIAALSRYTFDVSSDLRPDVIRRNMSKIFKVDRIGNKSRIVTARSRSDDTVSHDETSGETNVDVEVGGSIDALGLIKGSLKKRISVGHKYDSSNYRRSDTASESLDDQLRELNTDFQNSIEWDIDGDKVVPKSLNVAKLSKARLSTKLAFKRVQFRSFYAPFSRSLKLYTRDAMTVQPRLNILTELVASTTSRIEMCNTLMTRQTSFVPTVNNLVGGVEQMMSKLNTLDLQVFRSLMNPCENNPCRNGGTCRAVGCQYRCDCATQWTGIDCSTAGSLVNPCENNPCRNGGTCSAVGCQYRCDCATQWTGIDCSTARCPSGFSYIQQVNGCYKLVAESAKTYDTAAMGCRAFNMNAHLVIINDYTEQTAVANMLNQYSVDIFYVWIAAQRIDLSSRNSQFVWKTASPLEGSCAPKVAMRYTNWGSGEPNDAGTGEQCVWMEKHSGWRWNDVPCDRTWASQYYVCEIDL